MSRNAKQSAAKQRTQGESGSRADNPAVSLISEFNDDVWDFSNEDANPAASSHSKRIYWSFKMPHGGLSTDVRFRSLLLASKQFIYALRWHPIDEAAHTPPSIGNLFCSLRPFIIHLVSYSHPVLRFKDVLPHHCDDFIQNLLSSQASRAWKYKHLQVLQKFFQYRGVIKDGLMIDPLKGEAAAKHVQPLPKRRRLRSFERRGRRQARREGPPWFSEQD